MSICELVIVIAIYVPHSTSSDSVRLLKVYAAMPKYSYAGCPSSPLYCNTILLPHYYKHLCLYFTGTLGQLTPRSHPYILENNLKGVAIEYYLVNQVTRKMLTPLP